MHRGFKSNIKSNIKVTLPPQPNSVCRSSSRNSYMKYFEWYQSTIWWSHIIIWLPCLSLISPKVFFYFLSGGFWIFFTVTFCLLSWGHLIFSNMDLECGYGYGTRAVKMAEKLNEFCFTLLNLPNLILFNKFKFQYVI